MKQTILFLSFAAVLQAAPLIPVPSTGPAPVLATGRFAWDPNPEPDIARYTLYFGTAPGVRTSMVDAGPATTAEILFPTFGTYYVVATAWNIAGHESPPSEELRVEITRPGPSAPSMPAVEVAFQSSTDLKTWATVWQAPNVMGNRAFYRISFKQP